MPHPLQCWIRDMTAEERAYVAGIIDGEGNFSLTRKDAKTKHPLVVIRNTDKNLMLYISELLYVKNKVTTYDPPHPRKRVYQLTVSSKGNVKSLLAQISPYLQTKDKITKAKLLLKACKPGLE